MPKNNYILYYIFTLILWLMSLMFKRLIMTLKGSQAGKEGDIGIHDTP